MQLTRREFLYSLAATAAIPTYLLANSSMKLNPLNSTGAYAQAMAASEFSRVLFISGQIGEDKQGHVSPDFETQARQVWRNLETQLKANNMTFDNLAKFTVYLSDRRYRGTSAKVRKEFLGERTPAMTIVICGIYDEAWLLEIEAIAVG